MHFEPGLLAKAHRGILYVDEVNLLHDHLVDLLLDAAAMGTVTVERDGISVTHSARFVLVGTMNPEEGELRPQLLDRFGLTVEVAAPRDPAQRAEVVRRRLPFDADPQAFRAQYADAEERLRIRIHQAQSILARVQLTPAACSESLKCARRPVSTACGPTSSWRGPPPLTPRGTAARSRTSKICARPPGSRCHTAVGATHSTAPASTRTNSTSCCRPTPVTDPIPTPTPTVPTAGTTTDDPGPRRRPETAASRTHVRTGRPRRPSVPVSLQDAAFHRPRGGGRACRSAQPRPDDDRSTAPARAHCRRTGSGIHFVETVRTAAPHQAARGRSGGRLRFLPTDLRRAVREGREANLVLFVVDTSGSMAARERMHQVKTAILSLLLDAYRRRDRVGVITFRDRAAEIALPPTGSVDIAARRLDDLPTGGRTPLAEGLMKAAEVVRRERLRDPGRRPLVVIVTDGRATAGPDAVERSRQAATYLADDGIGCIVVDCENGRMRMGLAATLARHLEADHVPLGHVHAQALADIVRGATPGAA